MELQNNLSALRKSRNLSVIQLAAAAGVSRVGVYAIEAGSYVPNTSVSLKLAHILGVTVEELFQSKEELRAMRTAEATLLVQDGSVLPGQLLRLCRVGGRLIATPPELGIWGLPEADAIVMKVPRSTKPPVKAGVQIVNEDWNRAKQLLIAGCDPGVSVLARHLRRRDVDLVIAHQNSSCALDLLKQGFIHVAGTHIRDEESGEANLPKISKLFGKAEVAVIAFAGWAEGMIVAPGNPKGIHTIADLTRGDVTIINREPGAGCRLLLDALLRRAGLQGALPKGYDRIALGHLPAARLVLSGEADCCIGTSAAAQVLGLSLVPLVNNRYDLVIRKANLRVPAMQTLVEILGHTAFRNELESLAGYDMKTAGDRLL